MPQKIRKKKKTNVQRWDNKHPLVSINSIFWAHQLIFLLQIFRPPKQNLTGQNLIKPELSQRRKRDMLKACVISKYAETKKGEEDDNKIRYLETMNSEPICKLKNI